MRSFLIDTDTASDDAVALIMALRTPEVRVEAITVVSGNVNLAQATRNALYTVELCGAKVPVFAGADRPLVRERAHADWFHGRDGLGDQNYPEPKIRARDEHAVDAIIETIRANPGIEVVTLGPLTNIAIALQRGATIIENVSRCVVMGGNPCCEGNVTPAAEYNIWCDPEAARIVLQSGLPIELVGWQLCRFDAKLHLPEIERIRKIGATLANFAIDCNRVAMEGHRVQTDEVGIALPDPVAMAIALDPSIALEKSAHRVEIECDSELTRGMTVVDRLNVGADERNQGLWQQAGSGKSRALVIWKIDIAQWKERLYAALA